MVTFLCCGVKKILSTRTAVPGKFRGRGSPSCCLCARLPDRHPEWYTALYSRLWNNAADRNRIRSLKLFITRYGNFEDSVQKIYTVSIDVENSAAIPLLLPPHPGIVTFGNGISSSSEQSVTSKFIVFIHFPKDFYVWILNALVRSEV